MKNKHGWSFVFFQMLYTNNTKFECQKNMKVYYMKKMFNIFSLNIIFGLLAPSFVLCFEQGHAPVVLPRISVQRIERQEKLFERTVSQEKRKCILFGGVLLAVNLAPIAMMLFGRPSSVASAPVVEKKETVAQGWLPWIYSGITGVLTSKDFWQVVATSIIAGVSTSLLGDVVNMYKPYLFVDQITYFVALRAPYIRYIAVAQEECVTLEKLAASSEKYIKAKQLLVNDISMIIMSVEQLLIFTLHQYKKDKLGRQLVFEDIGNYLRNSLDAWTSAVENELNSSPVGVSRIASLLQEIKVDIDHSIAQLLDLQRMDKVQMRRVVQQ
jgi:hypothetical protein